MPLHSIIISENGETDAIIESMISRKPNMSAEDVLDALNCQPTE